MTVKSNVYYQGQDLGGKTGIVVEVSNYVYAEIDGFSGRIKFFRSELEKEEESSSLSLLDGEDIIKYLDRLWADDTPDGDDDDSSGSNSP